MFPVDWRLVPEQPSGYRPMGHFPIMAEKPPPRHVCREETGCKDLLQDSLSFAVLLFLERHISVYINIFTTEIHHCSLEALESQHLRM